MIVGTTLSSTGNAATTCGITATRAATTNYNQVVSSEVTITIAAATQTITFNALGNKTYGDAPFTVSATSDSALTVVFTSATAGVCSVASTTVTILSAGTCTINANQAGNTNYSAAAQVARSFTVNKAAQAALTITSTSATVGSSPIALTTSGGTGTGAVSYIVDSAGTTGCSVTASNLAYTAEGTCLVTVTKESDDNYLVASSISTSIVISAASPPPPPPPPPPAPTPTHKVTYSLGGGSGTLPTQDDVTEGLSFTVASATGLTRAGFTFNQWNDGTNNYMPLVSYTVGKVDVVLTALWTENVAPTPTPTPTLVPVVKNSYFTAGVKVTNASPVIVKATSSSIASSKRFPFVAKFTLLPKNTVAKLTITLPTGVIVNLPSGKTNASGAFTVPGMQFAKTGVYTLTIKVGKTTKKLKVTITK